MYAVGQSGIPVKFENEFYGSQITNYPEDSILEAKDEEFCGQKILSQMKFFKDVSPDKFYIKYEKGEDAWEH